MNQPTNKDDGSQYFLTQVITIVTLYVKTITDKLQRVLKDAVRVVSEVWCTFQRGSHHIILTYRRWVSWYRPTVICMDRQQIHLANISPQPLVYYRPTPTYPALHRSQFLLSWALPNSLVITTGSTGCCCVCCETFMHYAHTLFYTLKTRNTLDCDQSNYSSLIVFSHIPIEFGQTGIVPFDPPTPKTPS